ncbi:diaminopropionate ammonia-lyase [Nonomuraea sp. NPDC059023]|uniref:diaminopropionate ammonia-lyase n=1 Tax=unclassified Nonomuraea TaxID=2593643 RepID=UPI0036794822
MAAMLNPGRSPYTSTDRDLIGVAHARQVRDHFAAAPTPLTALARLAAGQRVGKILVKDESDRMGLGSFKALGGGYAVARLVGEEAGPDAGEGRLREVAARAPFVCASAGNHGISVAAGARALGGTCVVYLSHEVPEEFADRLRALGARVRRSGADYDESMADALRAATGNGWRLISDSSWPGYTRVPLDVMRGYTALLDEVYEAGAAPTHVFAQAGVGGLAAAAAAYVRDRWGEDPVVVVVEPEGAPCLLESVRAGEPLRVKGSPTSLGRLDCLEPSLLAFRLLGHLADAFVTVTDAQAALAAAAMGEEGVRVSPCGATGTAGLMALDDDTRSALRLGPDSTVLVIGTEGPV